MVWTREAVEMVSRDEMSEMDWDIVGRHYCRLLMPLGEPRMIQDVTNCIRRALGEIDAEMTLINRPLRSRLLRVRQLMTRCNEDIKTIADRYGVVVQEGRRKSSASRECTTNETETVFDLKSRLTQGIVGKGER